MVLETLWCNHTSLKKSDNLVASSEGLPLCRGNYERLQRNRLKTQDEIDSSMAGLLLCVIWLPLSLSSPSWFKIADKMVVCRAGLVFCAMTFTLALHFGLKSMKKIAAWIPVAIAVTLCFPFLFYA